MPRVGARVVEPAETRVVEPAETLADMRKCRSASRH